MSTTDQHLEELDAKLHEVATLLDECSRMVMDTELSPPRNVLRIGQALSAIFDIQAEIYSMWPELTPDSLKPELDPPEDTQ